MSMACEHKRLRCTDGVFYCLDCGEKVFFVVDPHKAQEAATDGKAAATEPPKRRGRKGAKTE